MIYLDTSALVKLVIEEAESPHLERWLVYQEEPFTTSDTSSRCHRDWPIVRGGTPCCGTT